MKILLITRYYPPIIGGISFSSNCFYESFKKNKHFVMISIFNYKHAPNIMFPKNTLYYVKYKKGISKNIIFIIKDIFYFLKQIFIEKYPLRKKLTTILSLLKKIRFLVYLMNFYEILKKYEQKINFDIVLAYDATYPSYIGYLFKKKRKKKVITIAHGNDIIGHNINVVSSMILHSVDKIIVRSKFIKNLIYILYNIDRNKIDIIPDGIIVERQEIIENKFELRKELKLSEDKFYILSVGLLTLTRKGYDLVLKSINELRSRYNIDISNINYILIGRDNLKVRNWLNSIAMKLDLKSNFKILVNLSSNLRNKYYIASDIFVMPSRDLKTKGSIEGFGNTFIEAGYYYLPSIGSNTGGIPNAIEDGKSGFLVNNFNELVEKMKILYLDKDLRLKLGNYAHNRVINFFTWQKIYNLYLRTFRN